MEKVKLETAFVNFNKAAFKVLKYKTNAKKICTPMHWHDRMEFIKVKSGKMKIENGFLQKTLSDGQLWIIPPKSPHAAVAVTDVEYDVLMFDIRSFYNQTELSSDYLTAIFDGRAVFEIITEAPEILQCFDNIVDDFECPKINSIAEIYRLIFMLYENCLQNFSDAVKEKDVKKIIEYIEQNFNNDISITALAEQFGYCKTHLCRKFKRAMGISPIMYVKIFRLEQANKMLKEGINISEVAQKCGFYDANYFTRCFKAHFGITPSKAREEK